MKRSIIYLNAILVALAFLLGAFITYSTSPAYAAMTTPKPIVRSGLSFVPHEVGCLTRPEFHYCYDVNSFGFRGKEPVSDSRCRVAVVGSSFAFGYGIYNEDTFAALLESKAIQPFNFAFGGATLYDMYDVAHAALDQLPYDVLIVSIVPGYDDSSVFSWGGHVDGRNPEGIEVELRRFQALKLPTLLAILPDSRWPDNSQIGAIGTKLGWSTLRVRLDPADYYPVDQHYNVIGHQHIAAQIAPVVAKLCQIP